MASTDAKPVARKNVAYRITFPILDADGDLVTGATGLDSEVSLDGGTFADCTSEAIEIATASGVYYLELTAAEMNADTVAIIVKTTSTGAKTTVIVLYPEEDGDIRVSASATGLDAVLIDGKTLPVATRIIAAAVSGTLSGALTGTEVVKGLDGATTIATATIDANGNRTMAYSI